MARYVLPETVEFDWTDQESADLALEEVIDLTSEYQSYLTEASGLIDERKQSIPQMFNVLIQYVSTRHTSAVNKLKSSVASYHDMIIKLEMMQKSGRFKRFLHGRDSVSYVDKYAILYMEKTKKKYNITADQMYYNPEFVITKIDSIMDTANSFDDQNQKYKYINDQMEELMKIYQDDFKANHWFITETVPIIVTQDYKNVTYSSAYKCATNRSKSYYNYLTYVENLATNEIIYLQYYQKIYERMDKSYSSDSKVKVHIDKFFKQLLNYESLSIQFNTKVIEKVDEVFRHQYEEVCKLYDSLQQKS